MITEVWHAQCYAIDIWYQMRSGLSHYTLSRECSADSQNPFHITSFIWNVVMGNLEYNFSRDYANIDDRSKYHYFRRPKHF